MNARLASPRGEGVLKLERQRERRMNKDDVSLCEGVASGANALRACDEFGRSPSTTAD
jgi:hypothetical protein